MPNLRKRIASTISITQLWQMFPDNNLCIKWLEQVRWNGVPVCTHCGGTEKISKPPSKPNTYWCRKCRKQFTVTTGTILHATKTPLQNWVVAIYRVMTEREGVSAMQLSKEIGVQHRTAWYMLHRIREACSSGEFKLGNIVETDESYIGGREASKYRDKKLNAGRGSVGKLPVIGARERDDKVVTKPVLNADSKTTRVFALHAISIGATVYTDDSRIYDHQPFLHDSVIHSEKEWARGQREYQQH